MTEVAVVVPTHNRPQLLRTTLRSVLRQQGVELAVAVVDDGSTDPAAVRALIEEPGDSRIQLLRHETPRGVSAARNTGIAATSSTWLAFCDDDDLWAPEKLSAQLEAARHASAAWAYTGDVAVDAELRVLDGAPPLPALQLVAELQHYNPVPAGSSNVLVRRSALDSVGCFDPCLLSSGDWDLWIRLARHGIPAGVLRPLVAYREHGATMRQNRRRVLADLEVVARRHQLPVDRARHYRWAAWDCVIEGRRGEALGYYTRAVGQGDLGSIGRAVVALLCPKVAHLRRARPVGSWARQAQGWLDALRAEAVSP